MVEAVQVILDVKEFYNAFFLPTVSIAALLVISFLVNVFHKLFYALNYITYSKDIY
jgi:hypothetical protein